MPDCFVASLLAMTAIMLRPRFAGAERAYAHVAKLRPVPVPAGVR
jgi:hypothetical protein